LATGTGDDVRVVVCRLTSYEDLPSPRAEEKWYRFHFTAVPKEQLGQRDELGASRYRVDVCSNRALKAKTLRLALPDLERLLYWCGARELAKSLRIDPSARDLRVALRWGALLDPDVARTRFPKPDAFEAALPELQTSARTAQGWARLPGRGPQA
jgi:hypothetical protein